MKRRTVPHQGLVARIGAAGVASVSRAPRAMNGAIRRVRRKRKASSISEDPAAGRSIPEKPRSVASIGAPSASSRSIAWSSPVRREPASDRQGPGRGDAARAVALPAGRREVLSSARLSPLDPRDRGDEEDAAQVTAFRSFRATGQGVGTIRAQRHQ